MYTHLQWFSQSLPVGSGVLKREMLFLLVKIFSSCSVLHDVMYQIWALEMLKLLQETKLLWSKASLQQPFSLKEFIQGGFFKKVDDPIDQRIQQMHQCHDIHRRQVLIVFIMFGSYFWNLGTYFYTKSWSLPNYIQAQICWDAAVTMHLHKS